MLLALRSERFSRRTSLRGCVGWLLRVPLGSQRGRSRASVRRLQFAAAATRRLFRLCGPSGLVVASVRRSLLQQLAHALGSSSDGTSTAVAFFDDCRGGRRLSSPRVGEGHCLQWSLGTLDRGSTLFGGGIGRGSAFGLPGTFRVPGSPASRVASATGSRDRAASGFALGTAQLASASLEVGVTGSASSASPCSSRASAVGGSTPGVLAGIACRTVSSEIGKQSIL
jgi:hypothetical protein